MNAKSTTSDRYSKTINTLNSFVKEYNYIGDKDYKNQFDTFFRFYDEINKLYDDKKIFIYAGDCEFSYLKSIVENDGPEYAAIIVFTVTGNEHYMIGVCVRGRPLLKKVQSRRKMKRTIKVMWGSVGSYFSKKGLEETF